MHALHLTRSNAPTDNNVRMQKMVNNVNSVNNMNHPFEQQYSRCKKQTAAVRHVPLLNELWYQTALLVWLIGVESMNFVLNHELRSTCRCQGLKPERYLE